MEDLNRLRLEFARIDKKDYESLRRWFKRFPHLPGSELAIIMGVSRDTAYRLRRRAGCGKQPTKRKSSSIGVSRGTVNTIQPPPDWRTNRDWLIKTLKFHSQAQIAKAVGLNHKVIARVCKYLDIPIKKRTFASRHPCATYEWCYRHYVTLQYGRPKCARLAGVSYATFQAWLIHFKIPVRNRYCNHRDRSWLSIWEKELINKLKQHPLVSKIKINPQHIHVRYRDLFWDNYCNVVPLKSKRPHTYYKLDEAGSRLEKVPAVYYEYGTDIDDQPFYPAHLAIDRQAFKQASLIEQRLAIHEFAKRIITRGWVWPAFPEDVLKKDYDEVIQYDLERCVKNGVFDATYSTNNPIGRRLMMHFFDVSEIWNSLRKPNMTVRALNILTKGKYQFNTFGLILAMNVHANHFSPHHKPRRLADPLVYNAIFKHLGITSGKLLDVNVGVGNRAIACAVAGLEYTTADPMMHPALDRGFVDFSGLKYEPYIDQNVDYVLYDEGWRTPDMQKVLPFFGKAKRVMVFTPYKNRAEILAYQPIASINIRTGVERQRTDMLYIW